VPLQAIALDAIDRQPLSPHNSGSPHNSPLSPHNSGSPHNSPPGSSRYEGSTISDTPSRRSRSVPASRPFTSPAYMGASLTMIDRHYGHLARDRREHAIRLLDKLSAGQRPRWTLVDAAWTPKAAADASRDNGTGS
jgi:hypothetical protein